MRVTSDLFVSALLRRIFSSGGFAAVERRGATEAGAIFIRQRFRDGTERLYAPAPQAFFAEEDSGERRFELRLDHVEPPDVDALLAREAKFDSDLWVVELEADEIGDLINLST